jgi:hypothetical protein
MVLFVLISMPLLVPLVSFVFVPSIQMSVILQGALPAVSVLALVGVSWLDQTSRVVLQV